MSRKKAKRKINFQKIFCFISFIFILTCCFWYGGRLIYYHHKSKKVLDGGNDTKVIATTLMAANTKEKNLKQYDGAYYFYHDAQNNYLRYSNLLWRIVKVNSDHSIMLVTDDVVSWLSFGSENDNYSKSQISKWLNKKDDSKNSGILENKLHDKEHYLVNTSICGDKVDDVEKITCDTVLKDDYVGLLSIQDYVRIGGKKSFIKNDYSFYLANQTSEDEIWYVNEEGALSQADGEDILGVRATITLSPTLGIVSGDGTSEHPYVVEDKNDYFGSYVKLGEDVWRVYDEDDEKVKLVLMDYVKENGSIYQGKYSNSTYRHNDTIYGSLAYYLNHTYYNSLSYKSIVLDAIYYNGYYGDDNNYDIDSIFDKPIDTKVGLVSVGDVILNPNMSNSFTSTGNFNNSTSVYVYQKDGGIMAKKVTSEANVVPCITILKSNLKVGSGLKDDPYRME